MFTKHAKHALCFKWQICCYQLSSCVSSVDDGTGTIPCCHWRPANMTDEEHPVHEHGQLVAVQGKISTFREQRQVTATFIRILDSSACCIPNLLLKLLQGE